MPPKNDVITPKLFFIIDGKETPVKSLVNVEYIDKTPWWSKLYQKIFKRYRYKFNRKYKVRNLIL